MYSEHKRKRVTPPRTHTTPLVDDRPLHLPHCRGLIDPGGSADDDLDGVDDLLAECACPAYSLPSV